MFSKIIILSYTIYIPPLQTYWAASPFTVRTQAHHSHASWMSCLTGLGGAGELGLFSGFVGKQGIPSDPTRKMGVISSAIPSHLSHDRWILTALLVSSSMPQTKLVSLS